MSTRQPGGIGLQSDGAREANAPEVIAQAVDFVTDPDIPNSAAAGETVAIRGTVRMNCAITITPVATRVIITIPGVEERTVDLGKLSCGDTSEFNETIPVPNQPGTTMQVNLDLQTNPPGPLTGWGTRQRFDKTVAILSRGGQTVRSVTEFVPWAIGGGAVGVGAAGLAQTSPLIGGIGGLGVGVAAKLAADEFQGRVIPEFPTTAVLATAALFGTGAILLSTSGGLARGVEDAARRADRAIRG